MKPFLSLNLLCGPFVLETLEANNFAKKEILRIQKP